MIFKPVLEVNIVNEMLTLKKAKRKLNACTQ